MKEQLAALLSKFGISGLMALLLWIASPLHATLPQLWPTFTQPTSIVNVGLVGQAGDDFMAITTFQGAYNQQQLGTRLYINTPSDATYWLAHALPATIPVTNLTYTSTDPDGTLKALLSTYGPLGTNMVSKYIICDPVGAPETCNMATTMAGINDAMVVNPDNLPVISSYGLTELADLRTYSPCASTLTSECWIGSNAALVGSTTINMVANPSGSGGTTGWSTSGGTVSTGTGTGTCAGQGTTLEFTRSSGTGNAWTFYDPAIPAARINTYPYIFSVQVCVLSGSPVFLDAYNGAGDVQSSSVSAGTGWQTLQLTVPIPITGAAAGNTTIKIQVRTAGSSTNAFFHNAAVIDNRVAVDTYQYNNLLASTSGLVLAQDFATNGNLRDYLVAGKVFTFGLTDNVNYPDEHALYGAILTNSHTAHVTPVLGYIDNEAGDVTFMSGTGGNGHFLSASDDYNNGSVWASLPQPASLLQPVPSPLKTFAGTIYVAFAASDGDNASIVEHQNVNRWTNGRFFGAVPMAWTIPIGMIDFAPGILTNFYNFLPGTQEIMSGPSGVGYTIGITGADNTTFTTTTKQFLNQEGISTVTNWANSTSDLNTFATNVGIPHVLSNSYLAYYTEGTLPTVVDGQGIGYLPIDHPPQKVAAIESWVSSHYSASAKNYLESLTII
jgi:hypothetical protein